jgi:hypothetical protein
VINALVVAMMMLCTVAAMVIIFAMTAEMLTRMNSLQRQKKGRIDDHEK